MKTVMQNKNMDSKPAQNNNKRAEIRDNLDSREMEENLDKDNDVTHNKKETKAKHLKQKK